MPYAFPSTVKGRSLPVWHRLVAVFLGLSAGAAASQRDPSGAHWSTVFYTAALDPVPIPVSAG